MKLTNVSFDEKEEPKEVTFVMNVDEAALIYAFVGSIAPKAVTDASGDIRWGNALYDVADCLSGSFFNRFWESGAREVAPRLNPAVGVKDPDKP
jgi:hypothetical protein